MIQRFKKLTDMKEYKSLEEDAAAFADEFYTEPSAKEAAIRGYKMGYINALEDFAEMIMIKKSRQCITI
jgi:hypothetical protein